MKLPKIVVPRFDITLPITGTKVSARPFLVGEQKVILQAKELGDIVQLNNAIDDVLKTCTFDKVDVDSLPLGDVEYMILQIRAKSVDEIVRMSFKCTNIVDDENGNKTFCDNTLPCLIPLVDVTIGADTRDTKIMLSDNVGVIMKAMSYGDYKKAVEMHEDNIDQHILLSSIDAVFDEDEMHSREDITDEELSEFLNSIYANDFRNIDDFISEVPTLSHTVDLKCKKCGHEEKVEFKGLTDFLV